MKLVYICILQFSFLYQSYGQSEPIFSQYMFNNLVINPAFAGSQNNYSSTLIYRDQWIGVPGSPKTTFASLDFPKNINGFGFSIMLNNDQIGIQNTNGIVGALSYKQNFINENDELTIGFQFGMANYQANFNTIDLIQKFDPSFTGIYINNWLPNLGVGLLYKNKNYFIGISAPSLLSNKIEVSEFAIQKTAASGFSIPHYFLNTGYLININEDLILEPSIVFKSIPNYNINSDYNTKLSYKDIISLGLSYRSNTSIASVLQLKLNAMWKIGYSYDRDISNFRIYSIGTNQIVFKYNMKF